MIENYEQALNDQTQTWHCHHRKQTDEGLSSDELKEIGLYFNRPASELIFMPAAEHISMHTNGRTAWNKGQKMSEEFCKMVSIRMIGNQLNTGRKQSAEERANRSKSLKRYWESPEAHKKGKDASKKMWSSEEYRQKQKSVQTGIKKPGTSEKLKGVPKQKYVWLTPDDELIIMSATNALHWHPDWILLDTAL